MAQYQEVDYCSEEVRAVAKPARGGGMEQHIVKETGAKPDTFSADIKTVSAFIEAFMKAVDKAAGRHHGHHGHRGSGHLEVRESRLEEDINTRTGEFHERKENFVVRADD